jgi:PAS domain-containing protein
LSGGFLSALEHSRADLLACACDIGGGGREAVRVADLLAAHALAEARGMVGAFDADEPIASLMSTVALFEVGAAGIPAQWRTAYAAARTFAEEVTSADAMYAWSASSQRADPGRKGRGAYSTPPELADVMAERSVSGSSSTPTVLDPSAGHGALLAAVYRKLVERGVSSRDAVRALHGVELDPHARELCCLSLWIQASESGLSLIDIADRVKLGNALCATWRTRVDGGQDPLFVGDQQRVLVWEEAFPEAFDRSGFDVVIANPPWESLRQAGEAVGADWMERRRTQQRLLAPYETGRHGLPPLYAAQGRGDRNLFKGFVELFPHLVGDDGLVVALLPGAFASDLGMAPLRRLYLEHLELSQWTGFENLAGYFPIDGRYKFGVLCARRRLGGTSRVLMRFLAREASDAADAGAHVSLTREELDVVGGHNLIFPEVNDQEELSVLTCAGATGTPFFSDGGPFGPVVYRRELDLTLDRKAGRFMHVEEALATGFVRRSDGTLSDGTGALVPLIEGRMVGPYDFFQKSWRSGQGRSARWERNAGGALASCSPQFVAPSAPSGEYRLAICDVTSATNQRTMIASWVPSWPCGNTAPVLQLPDAPRALALLAVLNSMTFDWLIRRVAAGLHLNRFYLETMPLPVLVADDVRLLAEYARRRIVETPRFRSLAPHEREELERGRFTRRLLAPSELEATVARGYGLAPDQLRRVMSNDRGDRKGLWRYFAAEPAARTVADQTIRLLEAA